MRKIRDLMNPKKRVYIILNTKAMQYRFMSDAQREGITYPNNMPVTERMVEDVMSLHADATIYFLGWAGRVQYHSCKENRICVDYEKYVDGEEDYLLD